VGRAWIAGMRGRSRVGRGVMVGRSGELDASCADGAGFGGAMEKELRLKLLFSLWARAQRPRW